MWSYLDEENTSRAAEFTTDWSRHSKYCGTPERVALPWFSRDRTSDTASDWNTDLETDRKQTDKMSKMGSFRVVSVTQGHWK